MELNENSLTDMDISGLKKLENMNLNDNQLQSLRFGENDALKEVYCARNELAEVDVSGASKLEYLDVGDNKITGLKFGDALTTLCCGDNQLEALDVSSNSKLVYLSCGNNHLTKLDVGKNTGLVNLYCSDNQLTELAVSNNQDLKELECGKNNLKTLSMDRNLKLERLICNKNKLQILNLRENPNLTELDCSGNALVALNLENNESLVVSKTSCEGQTLDVERANGHVNLQVFNSDWNMDQVTAPSGVIKYENGLGFSGDTCTYQYDTRWKKGTVSMDVTLNVTGERGTAKVTFDANGGTLSSTEQEKNVDSTTKKLDSLPTPTKEGFNFIGWYTKPEGGSKIDADQTYEHDTVLYAHWDHTHNLAKVEAKTATCTEDGNTEYYVCSVCGEYYEDKEADKQIAIKGSVVIRSKGHTLVHKPGTVATCETDGENEHYECSVCQKWYEDAAGTKEITDHDSVKLKATGHDWDDVWTVDTPATCEEAGTKYRICNNDPSHKDTGVVAPLGHDWGPWAVTKEATETEEGEEARICNRDSSHIQKRVISVGAHIHTLIKVDAKAATCTEEGNIEYYKCSGCDKIFADDAGITEWNANYVVTPALGHDWGEWKQTKAPFRHLNTSLIR
ncbi:MAG: InlB B-repeat-containing protein [Lachnospiraceae bacterium]|nr:InlB B-repeat-containing protein [Lachnospiraceae bacterium]